MGSAGLARLGRVGSTKCPNGIIGHVGPCLCRWSPDGQGWPRRAESRSSASRLGASAKTSDSRLGDSGDSGPFWALALLASFADMQAGDRLAAEAASLQRAITRNAQLYQAAFRSWTPLTARVGVRRFMTAGVRVRRYTLLLQGLLPGIVAHCMNMQGLLLHAE